MSAGLEARTPEQLLELGMSRHRAGKLADAETLYRRVLSMAPAHPEALHYLGLLGLQTGHVAAAEALLAESAKLAPRDPAVHNNWGTALAKLGRLGDARDRFEAAISLDAGYSDAFVNLANILSDIGEYDPAEKLYRQAIEMAPAKAEAHNNLGRLLLSRRRLPEAVSLFEEALRLDPRHALALNNLGNALRDQGRLEEAVARYRAAQRVLPDQPEAFSNFLLAINCDPNMGAAEIFAAHRDFAARFERTSGAGTPPATRRPGRIRVGYVSADFRAHAVAAFVEPLLERHDRSRFEVTAYYNAFVEDEATRRIRGMVEHFVVVANLSDAQFIQRVRSDAIDVLVDLSGHTAGNRLVAFAGRAAPVQATWLGYLNTTGLESMDVRITDGWADPPGLTEAWHTEQLIRLPGSLWCYRPWPESPGVAPPPALSSNRMTFGSANNPAKLNPAVFESWRQILDRVPQSRLLMYAPEDGGLRQRVARMLCREGEPADRVEFFPRLPVAEYLSRYSMMDIALDTFPCAGGTTTLDALWMGVPVVSIAGERPFSRGGASILGNLGFPEWLAGNPLDYVERAVDLASDLGRLQAIRSRLRERMAASALMDAPAFARSMEDVLANLCVPRGTGGTS